MGRDEPILDQVRTISGAPALKKLAPLVIYNLVRPLKTLRLAIQDVPGRRWRPRSPAMAAGLTDHLWTVKELLTTLVLPNT